MSMTFLNQLSVIPALLVILPALLFLRGQDRERATRRLLLYLLGLGVLLLLVLFLTMRFITEPYNQPLFQLANLLTPSLAGITTLILLNARAAAGMDGKTRTLAIAMGLAMVVLYGLLWNSQVAVGYLILPGALILWVGWAVGRRSAWLVIALSLLSLAVFFLFNRLLNHPPDYENNPPSQITALLIFAALFVLPALSVVMSALLVTTGLQSGPRAPDNGSPRGPGSARWFKIGTAIVLLLGLSYIIFWGSVWDQTSDGLFGHAVMQPSAVVAAGAGMLMLLSLRGKQLVAGLLFILVVPLLLYQSFEAGWRVSYHEMTERRAARIADALERYRGREGRYPGSLDDLGPRDLLFVQQPVILAGETWCYEGGVQYYRLSAFHREFFSAPVSLRTYAAAGEAPDGPPACEERLAEMKRKYYSPMEDPAAMRPPLPTPQPENEVGMPKVQIRPLLNGAPAIPGSWSPDSSFFLFATQENGLTLHFLNGTTGEVCTSDEEFQAGDSLRGRHAWLPDGRLFFLDPSGRLMALTPCQFGGDELGDRFDVSFRQIASVAPEGGHILLQSESAYWLLDGRTLTARPIPNVTPVPYEFHWDNSSWLPGGQVLAISRLDGRRGSNAGSTLFMIDGEAAEVLNSVTLKGDFGQSAPWIEILNGHQLIVNGSGAWQLMDFSTDPPGATNILADIFGVDVRFPDEISAWGAHVDPNGDGFHLVVRLNHPRNQATYLYDSKTGQVHVYDHEHHTLLVFPDGYLMEMPKQETVPTYGDEYDVVLLGQADIVQPRLHLEGHTPREYPHLNLVYLEGGNRLAIASEQGVSLVSLPDGEMTAYWELMGAGYAPWLAAAPDGSTLIAVKDLGGLYFIALPAD